MTKFTPNHLANMLYVSITSDNEFTIPVALLNIYSVKEATEILLMMYPELDILAPYAIQMAEFVLEEQQQVAGLLPYPCLN